MAQAASSDYSISSSYRSEINTVSYRKVISVALQDDTVEKE